MFSKCSANYLDCESPRVSQWLCDECTARNNINWGLNLWGLGGLTWKRWSSDLRVRDQITSSSIINRVRNYQQLLDVPAGVGGNVSSLGSLAGNQWLLQMKGGHHCELISVFSDLNECEYFHPTRSEILACLKVAVNTIDSSLMSMFVFITNYTERK